MSALTCCKRCFIALFVIAVFVLLMHGWITYKSYLFSHKAVSSIAIKYAAPKGKKTICYCIYYTMLTGLTCNALILSGGRGYDCRICVVIPAVSLPGSALLLQTNWGLTKR